MQPHHRSAEVWHALSRDLTVSPATHAFVRERYDMKLVLILQTPEGWKAEST